MKSILKFIILFFFSITLHAREIGETEITTEDGIEVFQNEKFYLLKENVKIESDNFTLSADNVKINFDKNLYDITVINAKGEVDFFSNEFEVKGKGDILNFEVKIEKLKVEGKGSELITKDIKMLSDGYINVNNINGKFNLQGSNSKLVNDNILIIAESIDGIFDDLPKKKEIKYLEVNDEKISYVKKAAKF